MSAGLVSPQGSSGKFIPFLFQLLETIILLKPYEQIFWPHITSRFFSSTAVFTSPTSSNFALLPVIRSLGPHLRVLNLITSEKLLLPYKITYSEVLGIRIGVAIILSVKGCVLVHFCQYNCHYLLSIDDVSWCFTKSFKYGISFNPHRPSKLILLLPYFRDEQTEFAINELNTTHMKDDRWGLNTKFLKPSGIAKQS